MAESLAEGLEKSAARICKHMNEDHGDSILAYAHFYAKLPTAVSAQMTGLTVTGFELDVRMADGTIKSKVLVPYDPPLESAPQVRKVAVSMHFAAYNGLGFRYKLAKGFYSGAAHQAWTHMPQRVRTAAIVVLGGALSITAAYIVKRIK